MTAMEQEQVQVHSDSKEFARATAALSFVLLASSLMNIVVFPLFDPVFTYARDVSVFASSAALISTGLLAAFRPAWLRVRLLQRVAVACLVLGFVLLPISLLAQNAPGLTLAASLAAVGRSWVIVAVGMAASRLGVRRAGACVALAFVGYFSMTAVAWIAPVAVGTVLFLVLPFVSLGLAWPAARGVLEAAQTGRAPVDFSVTQPFSFLPLGSQLFVCLFLFRMAFGYSLRFGEVGGVPLSDFLVVVPVAAVALYVVVSRKAFPADALAQVSVLLVVAGFFLGSALDDRVPAASVTLLSAGSTLFDMVAWLVLIAVAARSEQGAVAAFAWGRGLTGLGTIAGAALGVLANDLFGNDSYGLALMGGMLILVFVGYALIGLKNFSFSATIAGVTPVETAVAKSPDQEFETRCQAVAQRYGLSPRELEVFCMLARGRDRAYIQEQLVVSRNTVKAHVKHVYAKLDIHTHQELIDLVEQ